MKKLALLMMVYGVLCGSVFAQESLEIKESFGPELMTLSSEKQAETSLREADAMEEQEGSVVEPIPQLIPVITGEPYVEVGAVATLTAEESSTLDLREGVPRYSWKFGRNLHLQWGRQVEHVFVRPGRYEVELTVQQGDEEEVVTTEIVAYDKKGVLFSDRLDKYEDIITEAGDRGIWIKGILYEAGQTGFSAEEAFVQRVQENRPFIDEAEVLIFYSKSVAALQSFAQYWQKVSPEKRFDTREKLWVQISDSSLEQSAQLVKPLFYILHPHLILLTRPEALHPILEHDDITNITDALRSRAIEYRNIDERSKTNPILFLSVLTTYFVAQGISQNVIYLLFAVPFITFVIAFFRQFVGISTFGVYAPLMLALSFMVLSLWFGFLVFLIVLCVSYIIRVVFEKVELLYIPKVSLLLSALSLSFFLVLGLGVYFGVSVNLTLTIFPMLVMATISEKFLSAQSEEGLRGAIFATAETVFVALMGYVLVQWSWLQNNILAFPEIIFLPMIATVWLGRFTGLRLSEYFRFHSLFGEDTQE